MAVALREKLPLLSAAFLAGASGLGLEIVFVSLCGLTLGYGVSAAVGLTVFLVGWSLGAWASGSFRGPPQVALITAGVLLAASAFCAPAWLVSMAAGTPSRAAAWSASLAALFTVASAQGVFLPQLARRWSLAAGDSLALLFASNLAGAALGAWQVGFVLPAAHGRIKAASVAGVCALAAALVALLGKRHGAPRPASPGAIAADGQLGLARAGLLLAFGTAWLATLEWLALRLGVLWFGGMQNALSGVLIASMAALALGAAFLPRLLGRGPGALVRLGGLCAVASAWFFVAPFFLERTQEWPLLLRACVLVGPALVPFGAVVPLLHREISGESGPRLGSLLAWEALGALLGLPLSHFLIVPYFGLNGALAFWSLSVLCWLACLGARPSPAAWAAAAAAVCVFGWAGFRAMPLALAAPALSDPALEVLEFSEDRHFAVAVVEDGLRGTRTLMTDGFRAAGTGRDYAYMRALGHLPLFLHPAPERVGVLAFGTGTTAGAVALHPEVQHIEVLELSAAVIAAADWFEEAGRGVLNERERVTVHLGDGRRHLANLAGSLDVLTMEPLLPDSPFGVYLYTEEFYARARTALAPGGLLCQWVPPHALEPAVFEAVVGAFCEAMPWSSVWLFGTQVVLLGGEALPLLDAARFPEATAGAELLARELRELGLDSPAGFLARYIQDGASWPCVPRPLTDGDPWIVYRPRRRGLDLLADLPRNLRSLREGAALPPAEWCRELSGAASKRFEALAELRAAREAYALLEVNSRGGSLAGAGYAQEGPALLARARSLAPLDPELQAFWEERQFLHSLRRGVARLAGDSSAASAAEAVLSLNRALALRPERADLHWYMAFALERLERPEAQAARDQARALCPRIDATPAGLRTRGWQR